MVESVQWDSSGISIFFFPRGSIPADITAEAPQPSAWGLAMARWPAINCDPFKFFTDNVAIFDTTFWYVSFSVDGGEQYSTSSTFAVATGLPAYGRRRGYPAKNRAAPLERASPHVRTMFAIREIHSKKPVSLSVPWVFRSPLMYMRLFQTGKLNRISDTRRTRHDIHACFDSSGSSHPAPLPHPFYRMPVPRPIAIIQVNDVMKFKPLYSLVHIPSSRGIRIIIELSGRLSAGHLYLTTKPLTLFSSRCGYRPLSIPSLHHTPFTSPVFLSPFPLCSVAFFPDRMNME